MQMLKAYLEERGAGLDTQWPASSPAFGSWEYIFPVANKFEEHTSVGLCETKARDFSKPKNSTAAYNIL
jgi:hypothetical protein